MAEMMVIAALRGQMWGGNRKAAVQIPSFLFLNPAEAFSLAPWPSCPLWQSVQCAGQAIGLPSSQRSILLFCSLGLLLNALSNKRGLGGEGDLVQQPGSPGLPGT